ncbi:MAG: tRNA (adenosine(37)-N6)-threonylcarbamoyltransferase complex dimerization subunit type 1 TsaB [Daejeonella sp.]|uniref:tRNA (adenosine(37)-N6)-threonylcarbamoyltransferase complex dimerization subunit type 1 TsaB n=1 Tax=Daejeonella sp. TaxID=2805397 RepID=UPI0027352E30|nr:tRNA (adenosine(37)-N6)-threonylcarbamoyltransferase complex dimerization subunit type 1 TsaB [Daejeonella sp.]MDP3467227.1 tRNA (adenosine(37)-N6)-threonylcarbamoyltransferase complex dimerization subunit type 1 TsaB [Daejeonella sp.]
MNDQLILLLETATSTCSVALSENGKIIGIKEANERNIHASHITLFIEELMINTGKKYTDLNAVAVSRGPGSYTGLRIGVSTAKGLCYALDIPLLGINTLEAMTCGLLSQNDIQDSDLLVPMIDARRMEVYTGIFQNDLNVIEPISAKIVDVSSFDQFKSNKLILFGDGAGKFKELFTAQNHIRFIDFTNSAQDLNLLACKKLRNGETENVAYFEPFYLKDFLLTKSTKNNS